MKTKITYGVALIVVSLGLFLGFNSNDPYGTKGPNNEPTNVTPTLPVVTSGTVVYVDSLNGANDTTSLKSRGYKTYNRSPGGNGVLGSWFQGNATNWPAYNGPTNGYVSSSYNGTLGASNEDYWLVLPKVSGGTLSGDSLIFFERDATGNTFADSMRVMYSANDSVPEGSWTELGRFLVDIGGNWVRRAYAAPVGSANGRFAIRNAVVNGGPSGANGNVVGVDMITVERVAAPPPPSQWFTQVSGSTVQLNSISAPSNDVAWIGGGTATTVVLRTTNGGTWTNAAGNLPAANAIYNIYGIDANTALATSSPGATFVFKTTNGGTTWVQTFTQAAGFIDAIWMKDANNGFMYGDPVGSRWSLWKTTNGGTTWDSTGLNLPQVGAEAGWNNSLYVSGNNIWFGTNNTKIYYSSNNGANWVAQATTGQLNIYGVWMNGTTGYAAGQTELMYTTNSGTTWTQQTSLGTGVVQQIQNAPGTSTWWMVRQGTGIYKTTNNGTTWTTDFTITGTTWTVGVARNASTGGNVWVTNTTGGIYKYGVTTGVITPISNVATDYKLNQNYPNPFNPTTKITFAVPTTGLVTLKVYDMVGKEIATLVNAQMNNGSYSVDFNASSLSSGIYFYTIRSGNFTDTKKMMLIK